MKDTLQLIYSELPELKCVGKCKESCGPVPMSPAEEARLTSKGKEVPNLMAMAKSGNLTCPHLNGLGTCSIYDIRPLICRLWGMVEGMQCVWGCRPARLLTDDEARKLIDRGQAL